MNLIKMRFDGGRQYREVSQLQEDIENIKRDNYVRIEQGVQLMLNRLCWIGNQSQSFLTIISQQYLSSPPSSWLNHFKNISSFIGCRSQLMCKIYQKANLVIEIDLKLVEASLISTVVRNQELNISSASKYAKSDSKVQVYLWQWYWLNILNGCFSTGQLKTNNNIQDQLSQDPIFYNFNRNFYLRHLYTTLLHISRLHTELFNRLIKLIESFLFKNLNLLYQRKEMRSSTNTDSQLKNYKLYSHYFYLLYLLMATKKQNGVDKAHQYYQYLKVILQKYHVLQTQPSNSNLSNILTLWLSLASRHSPIFKQNKASLEHLLTHPYILMKRYTPSQYSEHISSIELKGQQLGQLLNIKESLLAQLSSYRYTIEGVNFLFQLERFLILNRKIVNRFNTKYLKEEEIQIICGIIKNYLQFYYEKSSAYHAFVEQYTHSIQRELSLLATINNSSLKNIDIGISKKQSVSYQRPKLVVARGMNRRSEEMNFWEYPIQNNEIYLLFEVMFWIAKKVDKVVPGHDPSKYPRINLRIFCNYTIFIISVLILSFIFKAL